MSCKACQEMQSAAIATPHNGLVAKHNATKLRPLRGRPLVLQTYECSNCGTRWLYERAPLDATLDGWTCLHYAQTILDPVSVTHETPKHVAPGRKSPRENHSADAVSLTTKFT
jgi:hypothetical protein